VGKRANKVEIKRGRKVERVWYTVKTGSIYSEVHQVTARNKSSVFLKQIGFRF
jgi:hypothetical protein